MKNKSFDELLELNCFSEDGAMKRVAAEELELRYGCEIYCGEMDRSVLFAHHARGCTIVAAKMCKGVVIYQNVTIGSNMRYNKITEKWENIGSPILDENVIVADGAKILGPVVIGKNSLVAAGAIITKDVPENSIAYSANKIRKKDPNYEYVFGPNQPTGEEIMAVNNELIKRFTKQ